MKEEECGDFVKITSPCEEAFCLLISCCVFLFLIILNHCETAA